MPISRSRCEVDAKVAGVYAIVNKVNGRMYVGSSKDVVGRYTGHVRMLRAGTHHCHGLQSAWRKYGSDNFKGVLVLRVSREESLLPAEQVWIDFAREGEFCYNSAVVAGAPMRGRRSIGFGGRHHSAETRAKMRASHIGLPISLEQRAKLSVAMKKRLGLGKWGAHLDHPNRGRTHCRRGHEFTEANTREYTYCGKVRRQCRACQRMHDVARLALR
jgi:group I intron endonuclease